MRKYLYFATAVVLMAFAVVLASRAQTPRPGGLLDKFRPIGGIRNNLLHPHYNAVPGSAELAIAPLRFADPVTLLPMSGASDSADDSQSTDALASAWLYVFGQFVDHDLDLESSAPDGPRTGAHRPARSTIMAASACRSSSAEGAAPIGRARWLYTVCFLQANAWPTRIYHEHAPSLPQMQFRIHL
jgi:hypothetical protein